MSFSRILYQTVANYGSKGSLGARFRRKRMTPLRIIIENTHRLHGVVNIMDVGGRELYWSLLGSDYLHQFNVHITIANLSSERSPVDPSIFTFVEADGCNLTEFHDKAFHIGHSNSVLEHVGDWPRMVEFARELTRVSETYFVQTPNYWFPVEPHCMTPFFHWLPKPARIWLVLHFNLGCWERARNVDQAVRTVERARLLNKKMLRALFPRARVVTERVLLLPKSFVAIYPPDNCNT